MKILITSGYFLRLDQKQWEQRMPYPPLATLYAVALLQKLGHDVSFVDSNFLHDSKAITDRIDSFNPDFFVVYDDGFNYLTKMCLTNMREQVFDMLTYAQNKSIKTAVSSSDSTDHYKEYISRGADVVILGEAEDTLTEVLSKDSWNEIQGVACQNNGELIRNPNRPVMKDMDALPIPAFEVLDIAPYQQAWKKHGYFSMNVATTRGCPFKCNWCAKPIYGNRYNSHSPEYILKVLQKMKQHFDFDHIWFCDDIFGLKPGWVQEFSRLLDENNLSIKYKIQSRADLLVKEDTVEALAKSGCDQVWIGAESGSQKVLDAMDKGTTIAQIDEATALMKEKGIKPCFFLQFGYPGEEWKDIEATISMLDRLKPYDIGVSVSYPLPGTPFYEKVKSELEQKANWTDSDELLLMYNGTYSAEFYKRLHRYVHRKFRASAALNSIMSGDHKNLKKNSKFFYHAMMKWIERYRLYQLKSAES